MLRGARMQQLALHMQIKTAVQRVAEESSTIRTVPSALELHQISRLWKRVAGCACASPPVGNCTLPRRLLLLVAYHGGGSASMRGRQ